MARAFRGISDLVYAEVTKDDSTSYTTGTVKSLAPIAEMSREIETSSETHYYDNKPLINIDTEGADTVNLNVTAIDMEVLADLLGYDYNSSNKVMVEGERQVKHFALGYKTKMTDGSVRAVWRYKGTFDVPNETAGTIDDGTDANGQELTFHGLMTEHEFTYNGKTQAARSGYEEDPTGNKDFTTFFATVQTPDVIFAPSV